jgi:hypothetical protein
MTVRGLLQLNQGIAGPATTGQLAVQRCMTAGPDIAACILPPVRAAPDTGNLYGRQMRATRSVQILPHALLCTCLLPDGLPSCLAVSQDGPGCQGRVCM